MASNAQLHKRTHQVAENKGFSILAFHEQGHGVRPSGGGGSASPTISACSRRSPKVKKQTHFEDLPNEAKYIRQMLDFGKIDDAPPSAAQRCGPSPAIEPAKHVRLRPLPACGWRLYRSRGRGPTKLQKQTHFSAAPRSGREALRRASNAPA